VLKFADSLRPRELANYDPENLLTELYLASIGLPMGCARDRLVAVSASCLQRTAGTLGPHFQPRRGVLDQRMSIDEVKKTKGRALNKIRDRLLALRHPLAKAI
jgi:hypothetical protein